MLVNRGERCQAESGSNFFIAGAVPVLFQKFCDEIQYLFLPASESHNLILGEEKGKVNIKKQKYYAGFSTEGRGKVFPESDSCVNCG